MLEEAIEKELLENLNDVQRQAVIHGDGPLLILAGAGSGKTRVITHRIAHLCRVRNVAPFRIAAVTFTNKATGEMRERLFSLIGPMAESVFVRTFHSLGLHILRRHGEGVGLKSTFSIYDDAAQKSLIKSLLKEEKIEPSFLTPDAVSHYMNRCRDAMKAPGANGDLKDPYNQALEKIYGRYLSKLRENNAVDYSDLIYLPVRLLQENSEVLEHYRNLWRYFLIDEYQDTNHAQYILGGLIAGEHRNIAVVGDDDQSIYSWRGADISNILSFENDYPGALVLRLEQNYRSTQPILNTASSLIAHNQGRRQKTLFTREEGGDAPTYRQYDTDNEEVSGIVSKIISLKSQGWQLSDMAIFYRTNAQSRLFEEALRREDIPYVLVGGFRFFDRKEIKDLIAYMSVLVNPEDTVSLERIINVPARGVGETSVEKLRLLSMMKGISLLESLQFTEELDRVRSSTRSALANLWKRICEWREAMESGEKPSQLALRIFKESGYEAALKSDPSPEEVSRLENIQEFINSIAEYEEAVISSGRGTATLDEFLQNISLSTSESDPDGNNHEMLSLMTLHNAKGLEFPVVWISGLEEGLLPHSLSITDGGESGLEEERRLLYVGITRARLQLHLSSVAYRRVFGQIQARMESRFVEELKEVPLERAGASKSLSKVGATFSSRARSTTKGPGNNGDQAATGYSASERIRHGQFGDGQILRVENTPAGEKLSIRFDGDGKVRIFLARYTPLTRLHTG